MSEYIPGLYPGSMAAGLDTPPTNTGLGPKRAVIYRRVSTEEQADTDFDPEGFSLKAQTEACERTAESLGAVVVHQYTDRGESAKSANRPALQAMLERLREQRDIDYVIVHKVDRLARSRQDDIEITVAIRQSGATLVSATENIDETPSGKLLHGIMATIAEFYSQNLATEAKKGARQKAKVGGTPYKPPIGYLTARERIEGREIRTVAVDQERSPHVTWAFQAYASGEYTLAELTDALAERGLRYEPSKKLPARPMAKNAVNQMLINRYYLGKVKYEGVLYDGRHAALVDEATFDQVQDILKARKLSGEKPKKRPHYLKGRLYCGSCGRRMGITYARSHTGNHYPYFYCIGRQKGNGCQQEYAPLEVVEAKALDYWNRHIRLNEQQTSEIRRVVLDWMLKRQASSGKHITGQRTRIEKLEREQQKLTQAYLADALPIDALKREQERVQRELGEAKAMISKYQQDWESIEAALDQALLMCRVGAAAYEHAEPEVRRQLIQAAFDKLWIVGEEIVGCDLKPGFVAVLDPELKDLLEAEAIRRTADGTGQTAQDNAGTDGTGEGTTYYRRTGGAVEAYGELGEVINGLNGEPELSGIGDCGRDWLPLERPAGQLPWEATNPGPLARVRGSNVTGLVGTAGFEPATPRL